MKIKNLISFVVLLITTVACGTTKSPVDLPVAETIPAVATFTPVPPPTNPPLVEPLELKSNPFSEEGQAPNYKITVQIPYLDPSTDPSVQAYNAALKSIVDQEVATFKGTLAEMPATPILNGSTLDIQYQLIGQKGSIWSIQFTIMGFADGGAHPYHYSVSSNYDLKSRKALTLDDVFLPNSNYLQTIADDCKAELSKRDIGFTDIFLQGADPKPENYKNWNLSNEGFLVITFDEDQIAPYAAGAQIVVIPFSELQSIQNPDGALGVFAQ
jgi:Protein of unknown function (DUF3298)